MNTREEFEIYEDENVADSICYQYNLFELTDEFEYPKSGRKEDVERLWKELFKKINKYVFQNEDLDENEGDIVVKDKPNRIFDITPTYRIEQDVVKEVKFTIVPLKGYELSILYKDFKYTFNVQAGINFFKDFLREMADCIGNYRYYELLAQNLMEFNGIVNDIIRQYELNKGKEKFITELTKNIEALKVEYTSRVGKVTRNFNNLMELNSEDKVEPISDIIEMTMNSIRKSGYSSESEDKSIKELKDEAKSGFIEEIFNQLCKYDYFSKLQDGQFKVAEVFELLKAVADTVIKTAKSIKLESRKVSFGLGEGFLDVSEEYAVIGLSDDVIKDLSDLALFDQVAERVEAYIMELINAIFCYDQPYGIVKVKPDVSSVPKELGIYSVKALHTLLKEYAHRPIDSSKARIGVSYYEDDDIFAVIEKTAMSEREIEEIVKNDEDEFLENTDPTVEEKRKGKTKIKVSFKIKPYDKKSGNYVDVKLENILKIQ